MSVGLDGMFASRIALAATIASYVSLAGAQPLWTADQVNNTMCFWEQVRAAVLRDTLYLDGGYLNWLPGLSSGEAGPVTRDFNPLGLVYTLNFSLPFNITQNITSLMVTLPKAGGLATSNLAPNYLDGAMLANDAEWFLYGGLLANTSTFTPPPGDRVLGYQKYPYSPVDKPLFAPGFVDKPLAVNMTRYIAYGGMANAPSENKAWYFGGMHTPKWGEVFYASSADYVPSNMSNTLISVDMAKQGQETWSNKSLPDYISSRANPELVWLPVGAQGILVVIGGVSDPEWVSNLHRSANPAQSMKVSPGYTSTIDVYDIASGKWYQQPSEGPPGQMTRGCAVVAPAKDLSSFNIYYYGGYDGLAKTSAYFDDVWVLSLPAFKWVKVNEGNPDHARAGHKCVSPYPDQMFVVGGYTNQSTNCVKDGIIQVFNLTSAQWLSGYDPSKYYEYGVPELVYKAIGGGSTGGATVKSPTLGGWADQGLAAVFSSPYPTSKLTHYYPYASVTPRNNTNPDVPPTSGTGGGSGLPSWAPIVLGVVLGLVFITCLGVAILFWRRRKYLRGGASEHGTEDTNGHRIMSWMRGQQSEAKAPTVTTDETPMSPEVEHARLPYHQQYQHPPPIMEMADTQIVRAELMDTSQPMELHDEALTPQAIIAKHTHFSENGNDSSLNPSNYSNMSPGDRASTISHSSTPNPAAGVPAGSGLQRPAAPTHISFGSPVMDLAQDQAAVAPTRTSQFISGVSGVSETDRTHLRHISDTTVSSVQSGGLFNTQQTAPAASIPTVVPEQLTPGSPSPGPSSAVEGPVSPPSAGVVEGSDYISARQSLNSTGVSPSGNSPLRRSIFHEHHEEFGDGQQR